MPHSYNYTAIQTHQKALENIQKKQIEKQKITLEENLDPCFIRETLEDFRHEITAPTHLQFMIEVNHSLLETLDFLNKRSDAYTQKTFNLYYTKILQDHQAKNGKIDIHKLTQELNDAWREKGLVKLRKHYLNWGNIYYLGGDMLFATLILLLTPLSPQIPLFFTLCSAIILPFEILFLHHKACLSLEEKNLSLMLFTTIILLLLNPPLFNIVPLLLACLIPSKEGCDLISDSEHINSLYTTATINPNSNFQNHGFFSPTVNTKKKPGTESLADEVQTEFERLILAA